MEADKLKQYSQRSCLVISGVEPPPNKAIKSAEETEEKVLRIIKTNLDISRGDFDYELDKVDKLPPSPPSPPLPPIKSYQTKKRQHPCLQISHVNLEHTVSENIFSQKRRIFLISLIKKSISMLASLNADRIFCMKPTNTYQRTVIEK